ncbi:Unknown protein, partial [Striga hermonthica]
KRRQQPPRPQQQQCGRQQARVFAVDQREADQHPGTMSGMIVLNDVPVYALFDTGATHSFISRRCLEAIGVHSLTTVDPLEMSIASGRKIVTDTRATDLSLSIDGRILTTDAYGLEMIFEVKDCPDRYRVVCAQIQLTGDARLWWNAYWSMRPGEKEGSTWDQFKELICGKYYPSYYRADMERQFLALRQGIRSVDEYEREFTRLGSF